MSCFFHTTNSTSVTAGKYNITVNFEVYVFLFKHLGITAHFSLYSNILGSPLWIIYLSWPAGLAAEGWGWQLPTTAAALLPAAVKSVCWDRRVTAGSLICHPHRCVVTTRHSVASTGRRVWLLLKVWGSVPGCLLAFSWALGWAVSVWDGRSCLTPGYGRRDWHTWSPLLGIVREDRVHGKGRKSS